MLFVKDKIIKLGGVYLGGQVKSIEIQENAAINVVQDKKGKIKKMQTSGYEQAKVTIDIILESTKKETATQQLEKIQRLFKAHGQQNAKLLKIVNQDCAARGISQVYFKSLTSKKVISESKRIASLELWSPKIAGIKVKLVAAKNKATLKSATNKSKKSKLKSPAKDTRSIEKEKKTITRIIK